ncbi:MAG: hypothetical protein WCG26_14800 [Chloroflexales bacterium]
MTPDDAARSALRHLIAEAHRPAQIRALADDLDRISADLRCRAEAHDREQRRPAERRLRASGAPTGQPGAQTVYVRFDERVGRSEPVVLLRIGRGVFDAYQRTRPDPAAPLLLTVQVIGRTLRLTEDPTGYAVSVTVGGVTMNISGSRDALHGMIPLTRYAATVRPGQGITVDLFAGGA